MSPGLIKEVSNKDFMKQLDLLQEKIDDNALTEAEMLINHFDTSLDSIDIGQKVTIEDRLVNLRIQLYIAQGKFERLKELVDSKIFSSPETHIRYKIAEGILKSRSGDFKESIISFLNADLLAQELDDKRVKAQIEMNIGTVYASLMHFSEARYRYETVLESYKNVISDKTRGILLHNLGNLYYALGEKDKSGEILKQALQAHKKVGHKKLATMSQVLLRRTTLNCREGNYQIEANNPLSYINILTDAKCMEIDNPSKLKLAERAFNAAADNRDFITQMEAIELMVETLEQSGQYAQSLSWLKKLRSIEGELKSIQESSRLLEQSLNFEKEQREKEIEQLKKEQILQKELVLRNEQLEVANEDLRQFAYVVSHDLKEPLRMIGSYSQLIRMTLCDITEDQEEYFGFVKGGVARLNRLLDGLSNYSTLKSLQEEFSISSLQALVKEAQSNLEVFISDNGASVKMDGDMAISVSPTLFVLLLQNLIQNGIKFSKLDQAPEVIINSEITAINKVIRIIDNGIGIPEDQHSRVFVIFQRLKRSESEGTGMGLAICKKIVQLHSGTISIESSSPSGTTIKIVLPNE